MVEAVLVNQECRCDTKRDNVGQRVEFLAERAGGFKQPCQDTVENNR